MGLNTNKHSYSTSYLYSFDEILQNDVNGRCKVEYRIGEATSSTLTIEKIKDMSSCGDKYGVLSSLQGTPYNFGSVKN